MRFGILGPLEVTADGRPLALGGARVRDVLATMLVHANRVVPADQLVDELWPKQSADRAAASLQVRLSGLRRALRSAEGDTERLVTLPPGYLLRVSPGELDAGIFERLIGIAAGALAAGRYDEAIGCYDDALTLWRGATALAGVEAPSARMESARLGELRLAAVESRAEALLDRGAPGDLGCLAAELEALTAAHPLRERLWAARMLALYRCGRQADALGAYQELSALLARELGIMPGPPVRELHGRILRQDPALTESRRSAAVTGNALPDKPRTRYALASGGVHIAYQVVGHGDRDILFVPGLMSHLDLIWEDPETAAFYERLATLGRLILFDKRDTGLSDRSAGDLSLAERMADVRAVMRAAGSVRAVLFGYSEGAPMSILFAASYPEQVTALILGSAAARWFPAADYPCGSSTEEMYQALHDIAAHRWGEGDSIEWYLPSQAGSARARELFGRFERLAVNPGAFLRMLAMIRDIDVRDALPAVQAPTLVIHRLGDRITPTYHGRYLASRIAGARYFEQPGDHSLRFAGSGDNDTLFLEIASFLSAADPGRG
jgi:DNA-binding SARP family transcriptional activator/pimeloyl-ACP methyl ester carboxylesterase